MIPLKQIKMYKRYECDSGFDFNEICHQRQLVSVSTRLQSGADKNNNDNDKNKNKHAVFRVEDHLGCFLCR